MCYSLPVHLLRQHLFCPRVPWFQELLGFRPPQPEWVKQGVAFHQRQQAVFRHRTLNRFGLQQARKRFHPSLQSERWRMHGIADCVLLAEDRVHAVEIKLDGRRPAPGHFVQVTAYALLASESFGKPSPTAFIVIGEKGRTWPLRITEQRITETLEIRDRIIDNLNRASFPDSPASEAQCGQCEYLNHCNDRT